MKSFVMWTVVLLMASCLFELSQSRKDQGSNDGTSAVQREDAEPLDKPEEQNLANGTRTNEGRKNVTSTVRPTARVLSKRYLAKRCCRIGYRAAKHKLYCRADMYYTLKYTNMEHRAKQKFHSRPPSGRMRRLMAQLDRYCIKTQLKRIFYKCCLDGQFSSRP